MAKPLLSSIWKGTRRAVLILAGAGAAYFVICLLALVAYRSFAPPITGVQIQRMVESWFEDAPYTFQYLPLPHDRIPPTLRHAAVAAEDGRFFEHNGIDWDAVGKARDDNRSGRRGRRGGSTISQQLVKNLFLTTHGTYLRKALEVPLTYLAELILPKERILDLYVNVAEWGRGVYGAEAAAQHHYGKPAAQLSRRQAAALAACLPSPRTRKPQRMDWYTDIILTRMRQMGY